MTRLIQVQLATEHERCFLGKLKKPIFLYFLPSSKLTIFLIISTKHDAIDIADLAVCRTRVKYELRMGPLTTVSVAQWLTGQSAKLDERFNSSWGLPYPSFVPRSWQDEKTSSYISLPSSKLTIFHILFINPLIPEWPASNFSFQCHPWIKHQSHENKGNDN